MAYLTHHSTLCEPYSRGVGTRFKPASGITFLEQSGGTANSTKCLQTIWLKNPRVRKSRTLRQLVEASIMDLISFTELRQDNAAHYATKLTTIIGIMGEVSFNFCAQTSFHALTFNLLDNCPVLAAISPTVAGARAMPRVQQTSDKSRTITFC